MFIEKTDICNFADDNTLYKSSPNRSVVLNCLEQEFRFSYTGLRSIH